jgi:hypothetical protein
VPSLLELIRRCKTAFLLGYPGDDVMETANASKHENPTGLEDVIRSVRELARSTRSVGLDAAHIVEREIGVVMGISERIRDNTFSTEILHKARSEPLMANLRQDTHRAVDLFADFTSVAFVIVSDFVDGFLDERRPKLASGAAG